MNTIILTVPQLSNVVFSRVPILMIVGFVLTFCLIIITIVRNRIVLHKNKNSPKLTLPATVSSKRNNISYQYNHRTADPTHTTNTIHFVTFKIEGGKKIELCVSDTEFDLISVGDIGNLTFQGKNYLDFKKNI